MNDILEMTDDVYEAINYAIYVLVHDASECFDDYHSPDIIIRDSDIISTISREAAKLACTAQEAIESGEEALEEKIKILKKFYCMQKKMSEYEFSMRELQKYLLSLEGTNLIFKEEKKIIPIHRCEIAFDERLIPTCVLRCGSMISCTFDEEAEHD